MKTERRLILALLLLFGMHDVKGQTDPDSLITVSSLAGTKWTLESTSPLPNTSAGVPSLLVLPNGDIRLYFCAGLAGMGSATSKDGGKTFTPDSGSRITGTCDGTFLYLSNGSFRFLAQDPSGGQSKVQIISYLTSDGLTFTKESGVRYTGSSNDFNSVNVPSVIKLPDGRHRMYYVGDIDPAPPLGNTIRTAVSSDEGLTWTPETTTGLLPAGYVDPYVIKLSNGKYRLFYRIPEQGIGYADSSDGVSFTHVAVVLKDKELADPAIIELPDKSLRMFLGYNDQRLRSAVSPAVNEFSFAQIGNGLGFGSDAVFSNASATATASARIEFFNDNGAPLSFGITGSTSKSSVDFMVPPLGTVTISTDTQGNLAVGPASVSFDAPLGGVIRFNIPGIGIAGVGESQPLSGFITPVRRKGGINTGIAIRNTELRKVTLELTLRDKSGQTVANGTKTITDFAALGHLAQFIHELFPAANAQDFEGVVVVKVTGGKVAATALELGTAAGQFTALPVTPLT